MRPQLEWAVCVGVVFYRTFINGICVVKESGSHLCDLFNSDLKPPRGESYFQNVAGVDNV